MAADDPQEGTQDSKPDGDLDTRVRSLETGQDSLTAKVDDILGILKGSRNDKGEGDGHATEPTEAGAPNIAHEIRPQLDAKDRERAAADREQARNGEIEALKTRLTEMAEKPPQAPVRKISRRMWGSE